MLLASVGWKRGCRPFSCAWSENVTYCRKEICSTYSSKESMPFVKSKPPLPTRSLRSLRAAVHSTSSALCLHHAHPFVAASEKSTCLMQRSKAFGHAVVVSKICCNALISSPMWLLQTFSLCGLEAGLPAFQLQMFSKWHSLPKKDLFDLLVSGIYSRHSFSDFQASTPYQKQVPDSDSTLHQFCMMVASCPSLRCSFRKKHLSHAEKQSVWSHSCGLQDLLQYSDCALSCAMRLL